MSPRTARLEMRLTPEQKELLERAAAVAGLDLTAFALSVLTDRAFEVLERQTRTELSRRDQKRFLGIIESDEEPAPALKKAARKYRKRS